MGQNKLREEDLDEVEDMDENDIRKMLVEHGYLKPRDTDEIDLKEIKKGVIECEYSVYLFRREGCFRRNVYYI